MPKIEIDDVAQMVRAIPLGILRAVCGNHVRTTVHGMPFYVDARDNIVSFEIFFRHRWEPDETALFRNIVRKGDRIVDIGGHIGYYTVLFGALAGESARVVAVEPDVDNAALLRRNVAVNGFDRWVTVVQAAAGASHGSADLYVAESLNRGDHRMYAVAARRAVTHVDVVTIDELTADWDRVDVIKMDIQGYEPHALSGMLATLESNPHVVLVTEFWPHGMKLAGAQPAAFLSALSRRRFAFFQLARAGRLKPATESELLERYQGSKQFADLVCAREPGVRDRLASLVES